jgi:pyridoxal 5'-phosphate synthase pdxT subunit
LVTEPVVGVLALQGAFARHLAALSRAGVAAREVRTPAELAEVDGLVLPGGESTTISKLLVANDLVEPLQARIQSGLPVLGTCAGMILLASEIHDGRPDQLSFGAVDIGVRRNGYGRQVDSFEADLDLAELPGPVLRAVFIRAPVVERVGPGVEVLATVDGRAVLVRQGPVILTSFHPELTDDHRLHAHFAAGIAAHRGWTSAGSGPPAAAK